MSVWGVFDVKELSAVTKVEESDEHFAAGVRIQWVNANSWKLKPISPILRDVRFVSTVFD